MRLLLDTNALIWWIDDSPRIRQQARAVITDPDNELYVSAASAWEIAIKVGLGKLAAPADVQRWLPAALEDQRFTPMAISVSHATGVEALPPHHRDPFDRLLIAQATAEGLSIVTGDQVFERYGVPVIRC